MRLILLYAAQVAFLVAGFAAVSSVFVGINSDAMSSTVTQLLSSTATIATAQAVAPLDKFSVQVVAWADMIYANPALLSSDPTSIEWTPEDVKKAANPSYVPSPSFRVTPGKELKLSLHRNNPLALYVYEAFLMPDNSSEMANCGSGRLSDGEYTFYSASLHRSGAAHLPDFVNCQGHLSTNSNDRLTPSLVASDWTCQQVNPGQSIYDTTIVGLQKNDSTMGKWTSFTSFQDPQLNVTSALLTFAVPLTFSSPDAAGVYQCTNAAAMDLNGRWLANALRAEVIDGVDLAIFWDRTESLVAWTLAASSSDPGTGALLTVGTTNSQFDDAVFAFRAAGWCAPGSSGLSSCDSPNDRSSVHQGSYVFVLRRVVHINARFTVVIAGNHDTFFGPGERARAVGIGVSVAVCVVCLATSILLWMTTVRPLRRLIGNMELAATFSSEVDAEGDSFITEVNEANVAFLSMHDQLQMAKPFMPQHLLEQFEEERHLNYHEASDMIAAPKAGDDARTVVSSTWRSSTSKRSIALENAATKQRTSKHSDGSLPTVTTLESRFVAVLVVNITAFDKLTRGLPTADLQVHYSDFVDAVVRVTKAHRGVMDSAQGDHIIISFNSSARCNSPAAKAITVAFSLRAALAALPAGWQRITCGVAAGHALCGALGSTGAKSHATLGTVVRQALGLQRVARALDDERREASSPTAAPGWCVGTARVVHDCSKFAHFRYEAVASLPPSGRATVIASIFPPVDPIAATVTSLPPHFLSTSSAVDATPEWLYAPSAATSVPNPHADHNESVQRRFPSLGMVPPEVATPMLQAASTCALNVAINANVVPQLAPA